MLMKQSKMQFQEIQISSLDNGCPEQLQMVLQLTEDLNDMEIYLKTQSGISYLVKSINISQPNEFE